MLLGQLSGWGAHSEGRHCHALMSMRKAKSLLRLRESEPISLIDGYKMLRMELETQQARALEWNGVHSWVTSLFQWCSKRRINPPNSLWKQIQPQACDGDSYKTTDRRLRHWRLTHIQCDHKSTPGIVNSEKYTSNCHTTLNNFFIEFYILPTRQTTQEKDTEQHWRLCHSPLSSLFFKDIFPT